MLTGKKIKRGWVVVCAGCPNEIMIKTGWTPTEVSLKFINDPQPPVCTGNVDSFDVKIVPHGFIIIAKIYGQERIIEWVAVKKKKKKPKPDKKR